MTIAKTKACGVRYKKTKNKKKPKYISAITIFFKTWQSAAWTISIRCIYEVILILYPCISPVGKDNQHLSNGILSRKNARLKAKVKKKLKASIATVQVYLHIYVLFCILKKKGKVRCKKFLNSWMYMCLMSSFHALCFCFTAAQLSNFKWQQRRYYDTVTFLSCTFFCAKFDGRYGQKSWNKFTYLLYSIDNFPHYGININSLVVCRNWNLIWR